MQAKPKLKAKPGTALLRIFLILILVVITLALSFWNFFPRQPLGPAGVQVFSKPEGSQVFLNGELVGVTPYQNQGLAPGGVKLTIGTGSASFGKVVKLTPKVFTIVNRELVDNPFLQAGETLTLEPGSGLMVLSTPGEAEVEVDDQKIGKTPAKIEKVPAGEHKVVVSKENYVPRSVQVQIHSGFQLILDITLASTQENLAKTLGPTYATGKTTFLPKVKILSTPTGFLRVRDHPSFGGAEISKVSPQDEFPLLEEKASWFKIRLDDDREGWISSQYAEKL